MPQEHIVCPFRGGMYSNALAGMVPDGWLAYVQNGAYNIVIAPDGPRISITKRLGTTRYNATAYGSGAAFTALADYWRHGTSLAPTQKLVGCAGTAIVKDDLDGTWDEIKTTWGAANKDQNITIAQGYAVFSTSNNDIPQKWDQTNITDLNAGGKPIFTASVYHLRRLFTVGETTALSGNANPSRSTYSAGGDITDFSGADAGNFIFDEDDGDRLIGVSRPFQERLYYFKGPNRGSIHAVFGTTLSTFSKTKLFTGLPAVSHKNIVTTASDIYWVSNVGIHSLATTLSSPSGGTEASFLSYPIQDVFRSLNFSRLNQVVGFSNPTRNIIGWAVPTGSNTQNDTLLVYNTVAHTWAVWTFTSFKSGAFMVAQTPATQYPRLYIGGYDGNVRAADQAAQTDDSGKSSYALIIRSPAHSSIPGKSALQEAQFQQLYTFLRPTGDFTLSVGVDVDGRTQVNKVSMYTGSGDLIGSTAIIGLWRIGSASSVSIVPTSISDRGRTYQVEYVQAGLSEDAEVFGYGVQYEPAEPHSLEAT